MPTVNNGTIKLPAWKVAYAQYAGGDLAKKLAGTHTVIKRTGLEKVFLAGSIAVGAGGALLGTGVMAGVVTSLLAYLGVITPAQIASLAAIIGISAAVLPSAIAAVTYILPIIFIISFALLAFSYGLYLCSLPFAKKVRNSKIAENPNSYMERAHIPKRNPTQKASQPNMTGKREKAFPPQKQGNPWTRDHLGENPWATESVSGKTVQSPSDHTKEGFNPKCKKPSQSQQDDQWGYDHLGENPWNEVS